MIYPEANIEFITLYLICMETTFGLGLSIMFMCFTRLISVMTFATACMFVAYVIGPGIKLAVGCQRVKIGVSCAQFAIMIALIITAAVIETPVYVPPIVAVASAYGLVALVQLGFIMCVGSTHSNIVKSVS